MSLKRLSKLEMTELMADKAREWEERTGYKVNYTNSIGVAWGVCQAEDLADLDMALDILRKLKKVKIPVVLKKGDPIICIDCDAPGRHKTIPIYGPEYYHCDECFKLYVEGRYKK